MRIRRAGIVVVVAVSMLAWGCSPQRSGRMVPLAPPAGWEADLLRHREARDRYMKEDPQTPLRPEDVAGFRGLEYWPPDPTRRFAGPLHAYPTPERFTIVTTSGGLRPCERYGWLSIVIDGRVFNLQVYRLLDSDPAAGDPRSLFLPFADATTGSETYPAGRYADLLPGPDGSYVLDFNFAYNPSCAYGDPKRFACPVTPEANRLPVRIEAGERGYRLEPGGKEA